MTDLAAEVADLRSRLACVLEATYWDRPYDTRLDAIRGMCDLTTDGMTPVEALLCGQCGEEPAAMVKLGTSDGWCVTCLDNAAEPLTDVAALLAAADEMELVIADGDSAECAAPVEGEVGRSTVVGFRDALYEEPHTWLRQYAAHRRPMPSGAES